jgi:tape measure domain-containing protein
MAAIGDLLVRVGANIQGFDSEMAKVSSIAGKTAAEVEKKFSGFDAIGRNLVRLGAGLSAAVTLPLAGLASGALQAAGAMEQAEIGFTTLLKSGTAAGMMLKELRELALKTPFEFKELTTAAQKLMAMGFAAKEIIPTMRTIGDATSALGRGVETFDRIGLALGQMRNSAKLSAQDMKQLTEAGIRGWEYLSQATGIAMSDIQEKARDVLTGAQAAQIIMQGMARDFAGAMEAQSKSLIGMWSNVKDAVNFALADIGKTLLPLAKNVIDGFIFPMLEGAKALAHWFAALPQPVQMGALAIGVMAAAAGPLLVALGALSMGFGSFLSGTAALGKMITGVSSSISGVLIPAVAALAAVVTTVELFKLVGAFKEFADTAGVWLDRTFNLTQAFNALRESIFGAKKAADEVSGSAKKATEDVGFWAGAYDQLNVSLGKIGWSTFLTPLNVSRMAIQNATEDLSKLTNTWLTMEQAATGAMNRLRKTVTDQMREQAKAAGGFTTEAMRQAEALDRVKKAAEANVEEQKKLQVELKAAQQHLKETQRLFKLHLADDLQLAAAKEQVRQAYMKLNPAIKDSGLHVAELNKQLKENAYHALPFNVRLLEQRLRLRELKDELARATAEEILWNVELATGNGTLQEVSKALEGTATKLREVVPELQTVTDVMRVFSGTMDGVVPKLDEFHEALKRTGQKSSDELRRAAEQADKDYQTIADREGKASGVAQEAWAKATRAHIEYLRAIGADVSKLEAELAKWEDAHKKHAGKVQIIWGQIKGILRDAGRDFTRSLSDIFVSSLFGNKQNEELAKQAADLRRNLAERTTEWETYQANAVAELEKIRAKFASDLAEQEGELRAKLADRTQEFQTYVADVTAELERLKQKHGEEAELEIAVLKAALAEKTSEYSAYHEHVFAQIEEARAANAASLAEQLNDLEDSLRDRKQTFDDYVTDVNIKLSRIGVDTEDAIGDETRKTRRAIDERRKDFKRDEEDTLDRINRLKKAGKKETDQEIIDLRKSLARKKDDLDEYIREQEEDLADYTEEHKRAAERQTADLKAELERRTRDQNEYIAENAEKVKEITEKHAAQLKKQTDDLLASLDKRGSDLEAYRILTEQKIAAVTEKHAVQLAKEEADLLASLEKRKAALDAYAVDIAGKIEKVRIDSAARLADEEADLAASLARQKSEYDQYVTDVTAKLEEIKEKHVTIWGQIADLVIGEDGVLSRMAKAFTALALDVIGGTFMGKLAELLKKIPMIGDAVGDIFTKIGVSTGPGGGGSIATPPIFGGGIPGGGGKGDGGGGGGGISVGRGGAAATGALIGSVIPGVGTAIGAAIGGLIDLGVAIAGLFGQSRQENTLNAIEENTRYIKGYAYVGLATQLIFQPKLKEISDYLWEVQIVALNTITENQERAERWFQGLLTYAVASYDKLDTLVQYATGTFELIRDEIVTRLAGTNQTGGTLTLNTGDLLASLSSLAAITQDGFASVVRAIGDWAKKPATATAVQYVAAGNLGPDIAGQLSTANNTLSGISLILSKATGILNPTQAVFQQGGELTTLSEQIGGLATRTAERLSAAVDQLREISGIDRMVLAAADATRAAVLETGGRLERAILAGAGGPQISLTIDMRDSVFTGDNKAALAKEVVNEITGELRRNGFNL